MRERARARAIAGAMSLLSAGLVAALILGVSVVAGHVMRGGGAHPGDTTVRIVDAGSAATQPASSGTAPTVGGTQASATAPRVHAPAEARSPASGQDGPACGACDGEQADPGTSVGATVSVGPAHTAATATAGSSDGTSATASAGAGGTEVSATVTTKPVADTAKSTTDEVCRQLGC